MSERIILDLTEREVRLIRAALARSRSGWRDAERRRLYHKFTDAMNGWGQGLWRKRGS